jgi:conjugal transfer ATP-binding protein TraC
MYNYRFNTLDIDHLSDSEKRDYYHNIKALLTSSCFTLIKDGNTSIIRTNSLLDTDSALITKEKCHKKVKFIDDTALIGNYFYKFIKVLSFPDDQYFSDLSLYPFGDYFISTKKINDEKAIKSLKLQRNLAFANTNENIRNIEGEKWYELNEELLELIINGEDGIIDFELWFYVKAENLLDLKNLSSELVVNLERAGFSVREEKKHNLTYLCRHLYRQNVKFVESHKTNYNFLNYIAPFSKDYLLDEGYVFHSQMGNELCFELFNANATNYNCVISGDSGQGKSFVAQKLVFEEIKRGAKVFILDRKRTFYNQAMVNGAESFDLSFNPLIFKSPSYLKELLVSVIPKNELSKKREGELYLKLAGAKLDDINSFEELISFLDQDFPELKAYFAELLPYFNNKASYRDDFIYVDLDNFPESIQPPLLIFLIEFFYNIKGKRLLLMDECHHYLRNNTEFIEKTFRELRSKGGSAIAITQNFNDFLSTQIGKIIASCSFHKIFFKQEMDLNEYLDSDEVKLIKSLRSSKGNYSEFRIVTDFYKKILRYYPTFKEYELFTTDYFEIQNQNAFLEKINSDSYKDKFEIYLGYKYAKISSNNFINM